MLPVVLFNANVLSVTVRINGASDPIWIGGTNAGLRWRPVPMPNRVKLNPGGPAAPSVLIVGQNSLEIIPTGSTTPDLLKISLPAIHWQAAQLYIYFNTTNTATWSVLNQGDFVAGGFYAR